MQHQVDIAEAKAQIAELLDEVIQGNEILITQNDQPLVKMLPMMIAPQAASPKPRRKAGSAKGRVHMTDDFNDSFEDYSDDIP